MARPLPVRRRAASKKRRSQVRRILRWVLIAIAGFYGSIAFILLLLRWIDPPTTALQIERRAHAWVEHSSYKKRYVFVALTRISPNLQHAVIAAEDERFFEHHGFDWKEIGNAVQEDLEEKRERGASTITQQLVRNLFLSTSRSPVPRTTPTRRAVRSSSQRIGVLNCSADRGNSFKAADFGVISERD